MGEEKNKYRCVLPTNGNEVGTILELTEAEAASINAGEESPRVELVVDAAPESAQEAAPSEEAAPAEEQKPEGEQEQETAPAAESTDTEQKQEESSEEQKPAEGGEQVSA